MGKVPRLPLVPFALNGWWRTGESDAKILGGAKYR